MWLLGLSVATSVGGLVAVWWACRRLERRLALERDRQARQAASIRAEIDQLRRGMAGEPARAAAEAVAKLRRGLAGVLDDALLYREGDER